MRVLRAKRRASAASAVRAGNAVLNSVERGRRTRLLSQPTSLTVHVTDRCSLRCAMCMNASGSTLDWPEEARHERSRDFSPDIFIELMERFPLARSVCLAGIGEPLLNPHLRDMATLAKARGLAVSLITNGTELADHAMWLANGCVDEIEVSANAVDDASMARVCGGSPEAFARFTAGLSALVDARNHSGFPRKLSISSVLWKSRLHDAAAVLDLAASRGIDSVTFHNLIPSSLSGCGIEEVLDVRESEHLKGLASEGLRLGVNVGLPAIASVDLEADRGYTTCVSPWRTLYVDADGGVSGCFRIEAPSRGNGDWLRSSVWNNDYFRTLRRSHLGDRPSLPIRCRTCVQTFTAAS